MAQSIFASKTLSAVSIAHYSEQDCSSFRSLPQLMGVSFTQGALKSLQGLETCKKLESLGLAYLRNFADLGALGRFPRLRRLHLENLPKLKAAIDVSGLTHLEFIYVVASSDVTVSLAGIGSMANLDRLWLNVLHERLDLDDLFALTRVRLVGLRQIADLTASDAELRERAALHGRNLVKIDRVGPKKNRQVQMTFGD
jgi:hypothetical protein